MRNLIIILVQTILIMPGLLYGQQKIEDLKTNDDVIKFVDEYGKKHNKGWKEVSFDLYSEKEKERMEKEVFPFIDSLTKRKWIVSDYNNDGKNDLIFAGRIQSQLAVLTFITKGDSLIFESPGQSIFMGYPYGINELKKGSSNLLLISSFVRKDRQDEIEKNYKADTLVYKFDGFIELNERSKTHFDFDSITYNTLSNWAGVVQVPRMMVYKNGLVKLYRNSYSYIKDSAIWDNGVHESTIDKQTIDSLHELLNYIRYYELDTEYSIKDVYDLITITTVLYANEREKKIRDYGGSGSYGLKLLYQKLYEIKLRCFPKKVE